MSYRKEYNSFSIWASYCQDNQELIQKLQLPTWFFSKESNFRDFVTTGQIEKVDKNRFNFDTLENELFWELFNFINDFFDFDSILFTKFEESRINNQRHSK